MHSTFMATGTTGFQYLISRDDAGTPPGYVTVNAGGTRLAFDSRFQVVELCNPDGLRIAVMVGVPYDSMQKLFLRTGRLHLPTPVDSTNELESRVLSRFSGSYFMVTHTPLPLRIYLDPGGSLPVVFAPDKRIAGASPAMILDTGEYESRFDRDLYAATIESEGTGGWISGDLTAHRDVYRLLPNHYLDLETWSAHRHWPLPNDLARWLPFDSAVEAAAGALNQFTTALARSARLAITLTAGFDSRLLLASTAGVTEHCEFATFNHETAKLDVDVAAHLAQRFSLAHRVIGVRQATPEQREQWDRTIGDCVIEGNRVSHPTLLEIGAENVLTGMYGEIGRCRLYRQDLERINDAKIDSSFVVSRLTLPRHRKVDQSIERWFAGLSGLPNSVILDLAFLELKFGSWAMAQHPIQNTFKFHLLPFAQRTVLASFVAVDPAQKTTNRLFTACIRRLWPELCEIPVNKYGDHRDWILKAGKILRPGRVRRYLRDRFA